MAAKTQESQQNNKNITIELLKRFCAYQERCIADVKLFAFKKQIPKNIIDSAIPILINENFIDEKRFTQSFARGKFSQNKWGRIKIRFELLQRGISESLTMEAIHSIDEDEYKQTIKKLILQKLEQLKDEEDTQIRFQKTVQYLNSKGFEYEIVKPILSEIQKQDKL